MINVNDFKSGVTFLDNKEIYVVIDSQHSKQGRGQANVKVKAKNLRTGVITMKSYTGGEKVDKAFIEKKKIQYLYDDGKDLIFMDNTTYEEVRYSKEKNQWEFNFLVPEMEVESLQYENENLGFSLPANVTLEVTEADIGVKGNSVSNPQKKATVSTGYILDVPMFINAKDVIVVSTATGKYQSRA